MRNGTIHQVPSFPAGLTLSPEFRLAVACSWIAPEALERFQSERIKALSEGGIDWDAFLILVDRHGIPVQSFTVLRRCLGDVVPERLYKELKARGERTAMGSVRQMAELVRVNRLLREHGIHMIPLKGVCLSQRLYGSPGVRASGDMDVLIRPESLMAADRFLTELGYRNLNDLTERQATAVLAHSHHVNYFRKESGQHLELHWRTHFWTHREMEEFWRGRKPVVVMGEPFTLLEDPILILFLCNHGSRHMWSRLKWLGDVAMMFADENDHDWDTVLALAERLCLRRMVAQTSLLVHWLYGLPLPSRISELFLSEKMAFGLAMKAVSAMRMGTDEMLTRGPRLEGLRNAVYFKRIKPTLPFGLILKGLFMCPTDFKTFPLPDKLFWLYVPLRPFFWFWRHFGGRFFAWFRSIVGA